MEPSPPILRGLEANTWNVMQILYFHLFDLNHVCQKHFLMSWTEVKVGVLKRDWRSGALELFPLSVGSGLSHDPASHWPGPRHQRLQTGDTRHYTGTGPRDTNGIYRHYTQWPDHPRDGTDLLRHQRSRERSWHEMRASASPRPFHSGPRSKDGQKLKIYTHLLATIFCATSHPRIEGTPVGQVMTVGRQQLSPVQIPAAARSCTYQPKHQQPAAWRSPYQPKHHQPPVWKCD